MPDQENNAGLKVRKIIVLPNGPYLVKGGIPLVRKIQVVSEFGEPLTWKTEGLIETRENYSLCRCGKSSTYPFCDNTHRRINFDGAEWRILMRIVSGESLIQTVIRSAFRMTPIFV